MTERLPEQELFDAARSTIANSLWRMTMRLRNAGFPNGRASIVIGAGWNVSKIAIEEDYKNFTKAIYVSSTSQADAEIDRLIFDRSEHAA